MTIIVRQDEGAWIRATGVVTINDELLDLGKVARLVSDGVWTADDLAPYGLRVAVPFVVPEGEQIVGAASYDQASDEIVETYATEPIPPQPYRLYKSTLVDRMHDGSEEGAVDEAAILEAALAQAPSKLRQKYQASEFFMSDDPMFVVLEQTIAAALGDAERAAELVRAP